MPTSISNWAHIASTASRDPINSPLDILDVDGIPQAHSYCRTFLGHNNCWTCLRYYKPLRAAKMSLFRRRKRGRDLYVVDCTMVVSAAVSKCGVDDGDICESAYEPTGLKEDVKPQKSEGKGRRSPD